MKSRFSLILRDFTQIFLLPAALSPVYYMQPAVCQAGSSSFQRAKKRPSGFAIWPTSRAAAAVPSRTPCSCPVNASDRIQAMTTSVTSKTTFMVPNRTGNTRQIASTTPSPARTTTPAFTSRLTPTATRKIPIRQISHCCP